MSQAELQTKITDLQNAISEHQQVIQFLQLQREELTTPPTIPPGASGQ